MLISFTVSNYRSFHTAQTLSMVANKRIKGHEGHLRPIPGQDEDALPATIFYGANGAGKSNLIKALTLMQSLILNGNRSAQGVPRDAFALSREARSEPSVLEIRFLSGGLLLEYGFKMSDEEILEEWLIVLTGKREKVIFERVTKEGSVQVDLGRGRALEKLTGGSKMHAQAQVGALPNQLFVSTVAGNIPPAEQGAAFRALREWFSNDLKIISPEARFEGLTDFFRRTPAFQKFATEFLANSSTGVHSFGVTSRPLLLPKNIEEFLQPKPGNAGSLLSASVTDKLDAPSVEMMPDGSFMGHFLETEISNSHGNKAKLPFSEHSDGTQRLVHLVPALFMGSMVPQVFVIDEIDRSLHPLLARKFIEYFLAGSNPHPSQLILTTHDTNLLDLELFRRDEIWFAEKNEHGASHLYSLAEFKVRTDLKIDSGYLHGRFGAIPFLSGLDRLFQDPESPAAVIGRPFPA